MNKNVLWMSLSVLDRKPITNQEARENYKEVIWDYLQDLDTLEPINVDKTSTAYEQKEYLLKLITLSDRWNSIGTDFLSDDKVEPFLKKLQDMCREYLHNDLHKEFYRLRQVHYTNLAFTKEDTSMAPPTLLANLKERAFKNLG
jgi:hypothetical protein